MSAHIQQISTSTVASYIGPAEGLHSISVQDRSRSVLADQFCNAIDRLNAADLVVDRHHRNESHSGAIALRRTFRFVAKDFDKCVGIQRTKRIDAHNPTVEMLDRVENGVMLDSTGDNNPGPFGERAGPCATRPEHRKIVGLGATGGVDDLAGLSPKKFGQFVPSLVNGAPGITGPLMCPGRIGEPISEERQHRLDRFGSHRPGRRMIEVSTHQFKGTGGDRQTVSVTDDAALYGDSFADVYDEWYQNLFDTDGAVHTLLELASGGAVCELGIGTGRLAIPLAEAGLEVVGIDASEAMLEALAKKRPPESLHAVLGDMSRVAEVLDANDLRTDVTLVFCAFNTLLNLTTAESQQRCVTQVATLLTATGRFVVENIVPADPADMHDERGAASAVHSDVPVLTSSIVDTDAQLIIGEHIEQRPEGDKRRPWKVRYLTVDELDRFAHAAGLRLEQRWSDWQRSAFDEHSGVYISVYVPDGERNRDHTQVRQASHER